MNTTTYNEQEQLRMAQKNIRHFGPMYDHYYLQVFRFIHNRIDRKEDAEDICTSAFVKAMSKLKDYEDRGHSLSSWLYRIASNEVKLFYRSQSTHQKFYVEQQHIQQLSEDMDDKEESHALLMEFLESMPEEEYDLIQMKYFEGMSFQDIADIVGRSEQSLRVQMHRLRKKMKDSLVQLSRKKGIELVTALSVLLIAML